MKISSVVNAELIIIMLYTGLPIPSEMGISKCTVKNDWRLFC